MADFVTNVLAVVIAFGSLAFGMALLLLPFWLLGRLFKTSVVAPPIQQQQNIKQEIVNAQYEYDRTLRRRD